MKVTSAYDLCLPKVQTKVETPTAMLSAFAAFVRDFTIGICTLFKSISSFSCHFDQIAWSMYEREKEVWEKVIKTDRCQAKSSIKLVKFINYATQGRTNRFIALDSGPQYTGYEGSNYAAEMLGFRPSGSGGLLGALARVMCV